MRQHTRAVYLFGTSLDHLPTNKLSSNQQVLQRFYYIHTIEQQSLKESARLTANELIDIWQRRANLPVKNEDEVSKMIIKLYNEWNNLKMNEHYILESKENRDERTLLKSFNQEEKKRNFLLKIDELFDIAPTNAFKKMNLQEDIDFYISQKKPGRPGCISQSIDRSYSMLLDCSLSDIEEDMDCN